jgi:acyl-CoA synthetase (AMP-forming)/AMP-acid ligase II
VRRSGGATYQFIGRRDHLIKSRGYRVELGEIEEVLHRHDGVREAVAIAIPDEEIGNRIEAVVTVRPGHAPSEVELREFCGTYLPRYMVPEEISFRSELPLTTTGKTDRVAIVRERRTAGERGKGGGV